LSQSIWSSDWFQQAAQKTGNDIDKSVEPDLPAMLAADLVVNCQRGRADDQREEV
jgi:hypothetical protein